MKNLITVPPKSAKSLRDYVRFFFGVNVPNVAVCEGHCAPASYLKHAFLGPRTNTLVWACRGGSKTMLAAMLTVLESVFEPGLETRILGGSLAQSGYMYDYVRGFLGREMLADELEKMSLTSAELKSGSRVEILPQSDRTVRGVHVPRLRLDEVEEFRSDVFDAALFLAQSMNGYPARVDILSTLHRPYGMMSRLVDSAQARGLTVFKWCLWEIIERCRDRSCSACPLDADCAGKAKHAAGYYTVDDAISRKRIVSEESWQSEMLCKRPNREGLFYRQYDETVHVAREPVPFDPGKELYRSFDWGVNGPTVCLWIQLDGDGVVYVIDELYQNAMAASDMAVEVKRFEEKRGFRNVSRSYCDPSGSVFMREFEKAGIFCQGRREDGGRSNIRFEGFETVRRFLKTDESGRAKLVISPRCEKLRREFRTYHYPPMREGYNPVEEPAKVDDHALDALRYFFTSRFPQTDWQIA